MEASSNYASLANAAAQMFVTQSVAASYARSLRYETNNFGTQKDFVYWYDEWTKGGYKIPTKKKKLEDFL